jgi:hypothetical protein
MQAPTVAAADAHARRVLNDDLRKRGRDSSGSGEAGAPAGDADDALPERADEADEEAYAEADADAYGAADDAYDGGGVSGSWMEDDVEPPAHDGHKVQFLPPFVSSARTFALCAWRCVPRVHDYAAFRTLMGSAKRVLSSLTPELVEQSLGYAADGSDANLRTVALLLADGSDEVVSAVVFCRSANASCAQLLVAGTASSHRRKGCMRTLLDAVSVALDDDGVSLLCAGTTRKDPAPGLVYAALGFEQRAVWPSGMPVKNSSDLKVIWVRVGGGAAGGSGAGGSGAGGAERVGALPTPSMQPDAPPVRRGAAHAAAMLGAPPGWPGNVPFTSAPVWPGLKQQDWPQVHTPSVEVRAIDDPAHPCYGQHGVFARKALRAKPGHTLLSYAGLLVSKADSSGLYVADAGGGLDVDAGPCGSEGRYLNHFGGIAHAPNAALRAREQAHTGSRWVAVELLRDVALGEEIVIDYGPQYPRNLLRPRSLHADAQQQPRKRQRTAAARPKRDAAAAAGAEAPPRLPPWTRFVGISSKHPRKMGQWYAQIGSGGGSGKLPYMSTRSLATCEDAARAYDELARRAGRTAVNFPGPEETRAVPRGWTLDALREYDNAQEAAPCGSDDDEGDGAGAGAGVSDDDDGVFEGDDAWSDGDDGAACAGFEADAAADAEASDEHDAGAAAGGGAPSSFGSESAEASAEDEQEEEVKPAPRARVPARYSAPPRSEPAQIDYVSLITDDDDE